MIPLQHEIARHGELTWSSDAADAGPYRIGSRWFILASFGERVDGAGTPGHARQLEAFCTSRAAFGALRDLTTGACDEYAVRSATLAARSAARSARRCGRELDGAFDAAVSDRVEKALAGRSR